MCDARESPTRASNAIAPFRPWRPAFTLIEVVVAVAIIALLMAIMLPSLAAAREAGRATVCLSNLKQIGDVVQMYTHDNGSFLPGPTSLLLFRSDAGLGGLGPQGLAWAQRSLPYKLAPYLGALDKRANAFDAISICPSAVGAPLGAVYGGLPPPLNKQRCYYVANTAGIEHGISRLKEKPWYATNPVNYFGYVRYNDDPNVWSEYERKRCMPKSVMRIREHSREWAIADLWHWEARDALGPLRNVGTWPFPVSGMASPSICGSSLNYYMPCQPFHNTTKRFSGRGTDHQFGSPRLLSGRTNSVYLDGHAEPIRDWKGTVNPCFAFDLKQGFCSDGY